MGDVRVVIDEAALADLVHHPAVRAGVLDAAEDLVPGARSRAPHATGAGAASIHAEPFRDGGADTARVSWERDIYYLRFHELGTRSLPARPFLSPMG